MEPPLHCHVCKQLRPCCRQPILELRRNGTHTKFIRALSGPLRKEWGLGCVYATCCGVVYGMYYNVETNCYEPVFLGNNYDQALSRVNHVKSFIDCYPEEKEGAGQ